MKTTNEKTTIYLDPKIKKSVQYYAVRDDKSLSAIINGKLADYLEDMADITALDEARSGNDDYLSFEKMVSELGLDINEIRSKAQLERQEATKES